MSLSQRPARVFGAILALFPVLAGLAAPARAQERSWPVEIENLRIGLKNVYKIGSWTPVWVDLTSRSGRFSGTLDVEVPDEDGTPTHFRLPIVVDEAQGLATFVAYVRPGTRMADFTVRVLDERGNRASRIIHPEDLRGGTPPVSLDPSQTLIVTLGDPRGVAEMTSLTGFSSASATTIGGSTELGVVSPQVPQGLPGRWIGYDGADVVVLDTNDEVVMDDLRDRGGDALRRWVRNGGHLAVSVSANWQVARELLGDMLPAVPVGTTRLNDSGEVEAFAGSSTNQLLPLGGSMLVANLQGADARGGRVLAATTETPLIVRGPYGFGRVTLIGLDVDQAPFADWADRALFWVRALDLRGRSGQASPGVAGGGGAFFQEQISDLSSMLYRALDRPPGVRLVPFGWVAFFVFLYILLIGPGDYFFLKRVLKRMELTWITFPLIVIAVSALAYVAAYRLKGTELKVVKLDIVDVDQGTGLVRGSSWMTLFSPQNRDYDLTVQPTSPTGAATPIPASAPSLGSIPRALAPGTERLVSWFGPADPRFGGGQSGGLNLSGSGYAYGPPGELDGLLGVRIPIWSTKSFAARWTTPLGSASVVEADLEAVGTDRLSGIVTNTSQWPLRNAVLVFGGQVYDQLGTIPPGGAVRVNPASRVRPLSGYLEERARGFVTDDGLYFRPDDPERRRQSVGDIARVAMFRGGMAARTPAPPSTALRRLDLSGQLAFERPMLVAEVDAPLAELVLGSAPSPPQIDQTSLLRVLLPLGGPEPTRLTSVPSRSGD